jgi:hypothetical protein
VVDGYVVYNFYVDAVLGTVYFMLSLQSWLFAMKYLESSVNSSLTASKLTHKCMKYTSLSVVIIYTVI